MVKVNAPELLEKEFRSRKWKPQPVMFSGNTDCYQPVEKKLGITRKCLEVFLKYRNPVGVITKNALIQRDADILQELASMDLVSVTITVTTLRQELSRIMEPRTSSPDKRLETIRVLSSIGIPVSVLIAPVIPGLNDEEIPAILKTVSECGAKDAGKVMLRLPHSLKELFINWLDKHLPEKKNKILNRIMDMRGGKLYSNNFGERMHGTGEYAESINRLFIAMCRKYGLNKYDKKLSITYFRKDVSDQINLF
jgi:DNA repair photolyase